MIGDYRAVEFATDANPIAVIEGVPNCTSRTIRCEITRKADASGGSRVSLVYETKSRGGLLKTTALMDSNGCWEFM